MAEDTTDSNERLYRIIVAAARAIVEEHRSIVRDNAPVGAVVVELDKVAAPAPPTPPQFPSDDYVIKGLPSDHLALAIYAPLVWRLCELTEVIDFSLRAENGAPQRELQRSATNLWAEFLELKEFADDPHYPLIRDHLRSQIKPRFAALIAACEGTPNE